MSLFFSNCYLSLRWKRKRGTLDGNAVYCVSFITTCLLKQKSRFRQQQKLLKVLQAIENDSAHLSRVVSPTEEQVLDPEVRTLTYEAFPGHSQLA